MHITPDERRALYAASDLIAAQGRRLARRRRASRPRHATRDKRGEVAIVSDTADGPRVTFIESGYAPAGRERLVASMRVALCVYAERDGEASISYPRAVWLQGRAGQWSPA